jgi:hypothetical protein
VSTSANNERRAHDVLITGPSRSGTTLACELLNQVPDTVALDEPLNAKSLLGYEVPEPSVPTPRDGAARRVASRLRHLGRGSQAPPLRAPDMVGACENIERFLDEARQSLLERGTALSRHVGGQVRGQKVADEHDQGGVRVKLAELGEISVEKDLSPGFLLAIKQTSGFIALLEALVGRFAVYALVRNPLAILVSWQKLPFHPGDGHVKLGEGIDLDLRARLRRLDDRADRQLEILAWYFAKVRDWVPPPSVIRYEDLVSSGGRALSVVTERAANLAVPLEDRNRNRSVHDHDTVRSLGQRLLGTEGPWWDFYGKDDVRALMGA